MASSSTVNHLLFRKFDLASLLDGVSAFESSGSSESPAGSAASLVSNGIHLASPVDRSAGIDILSVAVLNLKLRPLLALGATAHHELDLSWGHIRELVNSLEPSLISIGVETFNFLNSCLIERSAEFVLLLSQVLFSMLRNELGKGRVTCFQVH